ncbi:hypothetical protein HY404_03360 [Candidatus Microgenomates bacterium]|nr:hypothetical protein [Candidatus Microgenomates bacterium]
MVVETRQLDRLTSPGRQLSISDLPEIVEQLSPEEKERFNIQYEARTTIGHLTFPEQMKAKLPQLLGPDVSLEEASNQLLTFIQDRFIKEEAVYNLLRSRRPRTTTTESLFKKAIVEKKDDCSFCDPENSTPVNGSARIRKGKVISSGNLTPFADYHELLIFNHDPYEIEWETFSDIMDCAIEMINYQYLKDPTIKNFELIMNFGFKAGASIPHGHAQVLGFRGSMHRFIVEHYNAMANIYKSVYQQDFWEDKFKIHQSLGLGWNTGEDVWTLATLTPKKNRGLTIFDNISNRFGVSTEFKNTFYQSLRFMFDEEAVEEFNFALLFPPFGRNDDYWKNSRNFVIFVDRGSSRTPTNDMGAMEAITGLVVVEQDPFRWGTKLGKYLQAA